MQLFLMVLNKVEILDDLLEGLMDKGITGATILNSTGMVKELAKRGEDYPIFGSLRFMIDLERSESKTIFMVVRDEQVDLIKKTIRQFIDISQPDTAVIFTLPVTSAEGVGF